MEPSALQNVLAERARLAEPVVRLAGESHFPYAHPDCLHQTWLTPERMAAAAASVGSVDPNPFAPGPAGGLRLWDSVAAPTPWTEFRTMPPQRIPAFRKTNATWLNETVPAFYRVGMPVDGVVVRRPQSPAIVDLVSERWGWRMLEAAHALAHRAEVQAKFRPQAMGLYGSLTINWVARLATALRYNLPVDVSGEPPPLRPAEAAQSNDGLLRYGISLCDSNSFHAPFVRVPCLGLRAPVPDRDLCFLAVGVYIEPHPKGFTDGTGKWMEVNRWSCSPTMVSIAGWELADVVMRQQPSAVDAWSQPEFVVAAPALMPWDSLPAYIEAAKAARGEAVADNVRYWHVMDWLESKAMRELVASSPPIPCRECLRLNMRAEGAPGRPQSRPPKEKPNRKSQYLTREEREWLDWDERIDQVFDMVEKAVVYYEARLWGATAAKRKRRARRAASNCRKAAIARAASLEKRAQAALRGGRPTKAQQLMTEARALRNAARNGIIPTNEKEIEKAEAQTAGAVGADPETPDAALDGAGGR